LLFWWSNARMPAGASEPKSMRHRFLAMELKVPLSTLSVSNLSDTMAAVG